MPRTCTICQHPDREEIDRALVAGEPYRGIAQRFAASADAILRHKRDHVPATLVRAQEVEEVAHADSLLDQVRTLQTKALVILDKAEEAGDLRTALAAIGQARGNLELLAELTKQLDRRPQVNLTLSPEWLAVRSTLLSALLPYPDARAAVAGHLVTLEASGGSRN